MSTSKGLAITSISVPEDLSGAHEFKDNEIIIDPCPDRLRARTILPTTAAPSTTAAPTATPATAAPVAGSSPLGGDGVGDRDPNDDPSTDAAAARGVTVVAAIVALFYAL